MTTPENEPAPEVDRAAPCSALWSFFAAHYRREYGREPDMDNPQTVLCAAWFRLGIADDAARRKLHDWKPPAQKL